MSRDQRNPHGSQRRMNASQRVLARNTRAGIAAIDRINAIGAAEIADAARDLGDGPMTEQGYKQLMATVDAVLRRQYGSSRETAEEGQMGRAILRQCAQTVTDKRGTEGKRLAARWAQIASKDPELVREIVRRHGQR